MIHKDFVNYRYNPVYSIVVDHKSLLKYKYNLNIIYADKGKLYKLRRAYGEMSKLYYIYSLYKEGSMTSDYVGLNHYSRYFNFTDNIPNFNNIFKNYDVILNSPYFCKNGIRNQFCWCHGCKKYDEIIDIIKEIKPDYYKAALEINNSTLIYCCNLFIMKQKDFLNYCEFIFDVLFEFDRRNNFTSDEDVFNYFKQFFPKNNTDSYRIILLQSRLQGFLAERIGNIFFNKNFKRKKIFGFGNFKTNNKTKIEASNKNNINYFDGIYIIKKINLIFLIFIALLSFINIVLNKKIFKNILI